MAKSSSIERDLKRRRLTTKFAVRRAKLRVIIRNNKLAPEERFAAQLKLASLPRNSSPVRQHNRCLVTGRPRGNYRKFKISRIALRDMAAAGMIPGMVKSSW
jgi:small subunit ribosomal protein S14